MPGDLMIENGEGSGALLQIERERAWLLEEIKKASDPEQIDKMLARKVVLDVEIYPDIDSISVALLDPKLEGWQGRETAHAYLYFKGNYPEDALSNFSKIQEADILRISRFLKLPIGQKICFYIFSDLKEKQLADPLKSPGMASARYSQMAVFRIWNKSMPDISFPHESTHLVSHQAGDPYVLKTVVENADNGFSEITTPMLSTNFFQEGLAVAVNEMEFNLPYQDVRGESKIADDWVRDYLKTNPQIDLRNNLLMSGFDALGSPAGPAIAGSFCKYLIENFGAWRFMECYKALSENEKIDWNCQKIQAVFQKPIEELSRRWLSEISAAN